DAGGAAADGRRGLELVGRTRVVRAVAEVVDVAVAGGGAAERRALRVGGTGGSRAGAGLGQVANAGGAAALRRRRLELVGRARVVCAIAEIVDVAVGGGGAAKRRAL